jgi:hypothetical protein
MRDNIIEIGDTKGRAFRIEVWTPSAWTRVKFWNGGGRYHRGDWRAVDKGFIRYNSGDAYRFYGYSNPDVVNLWIGLAGDFDHLDDAKLFKWPGIALYDYDDWDGTNSNGKGYIEQPWVLGLAPGEITWTRLDD